MLRAEIEVDSLNVVMDISEICNEHNHMDPQRSKCEDSVDKNRNLIFCVCVFKPLKPDLAFTGAHTHMAVFSVEGVSEQPQTLYGKRRELKMSGYITKSRVT